MKLQKAMFALTAMMFLFAGKSSAQQVQTDYDRSADFRFMSIESRIRSMQPWQQKAGPRWIRVATFPW